MKYVPTIVSFCLIVIIRNPLFRRPIGADASKRRSNFFIYSDAFGVIFLFTPTLGGVGSYYVGIYYVGFYYRLLLSASIVGSYCNTFQLLPAFSFYNAGKRWVG